LLGNKRGPRSVFFPPLRTGVIKREVAKKGDKKKEERKIFEWLNELRY